MTTGISIAMAFIAGGRGALRTAPLTQRVPGVVEREGQSRLACLWCASQAQGARGQSRLAKLRRVPTPGRMRASPLTYHVVQCRLVKTMSDN
jgi:hypothetical protein